MKALVVTLTLLSTNLFFAHFEHYTLKNALLLSLIQAVTVGLCLAFVTKIEKPLELD